MKFISSILLLLFTFLGTSAQEKPLTKELEHWSNGNKKVEGWYSNTDATGKWTWWFANGNKKMEGFFDYGVGQGKWTWYHMNGNKMQEGKYKVGIKTGEWLAWHLNGQQLVAGNMADGRYHGKFTFYYDWGELKRVEMYEKGVLLETTYLHPKLKESEDKDKIPF